MPFLPRNTAVALVAALGATALHAQRADTIVVTASRTAQPVSALLADLTVIDEEEILRSGAQSLPQLLQRQPGVEVTIAGGPGSTSGIFLRGANAGQTLVLIDGLRVGSSSVGATAIEAIPLDQIERIEILRGPASSLYGADAIGGVVQVFTRRARDNAFSANAAASYGSRDTANASAGVRGGLGALRLGVNVGATRSDGFDVIVNPANFSYNPDRDGYSTRNVGVNAALPWAAGQELSVHALRNRLETQSDGGAGFDDRTVTTLESFSVVSRNQWGERWTSTLTVGEGRDDSVSKTSFGDAPFTTRQRQYAWQGDARLSASTLSLVLERREEKLATTNDFAMTSRDTDSVAGVYQLAQGRWALQAHLRRDDSSQFGEQTTGGVAVGFRATPMWRVTAGYSTGFKAPSFNDLYFPGFSNGALVPEEARNTEVGAYWNASRGDSRFEARVVAYRNRVENLIVFGCDAEFNCRPDNVGKATLTGATLGFDWARGDTLIKGSLDLQRPENDANGNLLPRRARRHGALQVLHQMGPVRVGAELVAASERYEDAANAVRMPGYGILNLSAEWRLSRAWTAFVRANNVFDRDYQLVADFSTGGAAVYAGVRWQAGRGHPR